MKFEWFTICGNNQSQKLSCEKGQEVSKKFLFRQNFNLSIYSFRNFKKSQWMIFSYSDYITLFSNVIFRLPATSTNLKFTFSDFHQCGLSVNYFCSDFWASNTSCVFICYVKSQWTFKYVGKNICGHFSLE